MKKSLLLVLILSLGSACARVPFQETALVSLESRAPWSVVERFQSSIPASFQLLTTVVFEYNGNKFTGIGTVEINTKERTFKVAGLNPMGVKLFELSGNDRGVTNHYTLAAIAQYGDVSTAVGNDIRRIYFDLVPSPEAPVWKKKYQVIYRQFSGSGNLEYVYAGAEGDLVEKRYYEDQVPVWRVSYYEYRNQEGKRYPQGIVFINYQYGYRLTVRQKGLNS